jgi:hypothetical protein
VTALYRLLTHINQCPQSITDSTNRFLATDSNTGTITVSLNYTLQISHKVFSSQPDFQLSTHGTVTDSFLHSSVQNWLGCPSFLPYNISARTNRKHSSPILVGPCLALRCVTTVLMWATEKTALLLLRACMLRALPSNDRCLQSHRFARCYTP